MTHLRLFSPLIFLLLSPHLVDGRSKYLHSENGLKLQGRYLEHKVKSGYLRTRNLKKEGDGEETIPKEKNKEVYSKGKEENEGVIEEIKAKSEVYEEGKKGKKGKNSEEVSTDKVDDSEVSEKGKHDLKKNEKEGNEDSETTKDEKKKGDTEEKDEESEDYSEREKKERKKSEKKSKEEESQSPKANDLDLVKEIETPKETYKKAKGNGKKKSDGKTVESSSDENSEGDDGSSASPPAVTPYDPSVSSPTISIPNDDAAVTMINTTDEESISENLMSASCSDIAFSAASVETLTTSQSNSSAVASTSEAVDEDTEKMGTVKYRYQIETRTDTPSNDTMTRIKEDIFLTLADDLCDDERRLIESTQHIHRHLKIVQISSPPLDYRSSKDCLLEHRSFDGVCNVYKGKIHFMINDEGSLTRMRDTKAYVKLFLIYYAETTNFTAIDSDLLSMRVLEDEDEEEKEESVDQNDSDSSSTSSSTTTETTATTETATTESAEDDEKDDEVITSSMAMLAVPNEEGVTSSGLSTTTVVGILASVGLLALSVHLFVAGYQRHHEE